MKTRCVRDRHAPEVIQEWQDDLSNFLEEHDLGEAELHGLVAVLRRRATGAPKDLVVLAYEDAELLFPGLLVS